MASSNADIEKAGSESKESGSSSPPIQKKFSVRDHWLNDLDLTHGDLLLFACCITTGLLDCSTFRNWSAFVSMQTGNTIILALSSASLPYGQPWAWAATLISLISFFLGAFVCTRVTGFFGAKRRIVLMCSMLTQSCLIIVAAALATAHILITDGPNVADAGAVLHDPRILIAIGPLAFQSGATIAMSRLLGFGNEIPVTVYTSTYAALAADPKLFHLRGNKPRDRRVCAVIAIFAGAFVATWLERKSVGPIATFWMAAGIKMILAIALGVAFPQAKMAPLTALPISGKK